MGYTDMALRYESGESRNPYIPFYIQSDFSNSGIIVI